MGLLSSKLLLPPLLISIVLFFLLSNPNPNPNPNSLVTLLALGNDAPDLFSSVATLRCDEPRTDLAHPLRRRLRHKFGFDHRHAFPFGSASIHSECLLFSGGAGDVLCVFEWEMYLWQGVGFVGLYVFFVWFLFWMDLGSTDACKRREEEVEEVEMGLVEKSAAEVEGGDGREVVGDRWSLFWMMGKISRLWEIPVTIILKLTIPSVSPSEYSRFYTSANICLCPLLILYSLSSFVPVDTQIVFILPHSQFPLWTVVLFISFSLGVAHFFFENEPQQKDSENKNTATTLVAFVMSVFWISTMAGELLNCLAAVGTILDLPPAILGLTVLAWGNSVGDIVADVALAKAGQPAMAMAGCFVGPMFNMLIGLGSAMVIETAKAYPGAYELRFHVGIVVAFVFLLLSLMGSLLVVTWFRFRVPRFWGFCLVGLYVLFTAVSLAIARFAG
ncbi:uncharacterized protein A4U43_C02F13400 [Asparagus officinalis]|uniref:Sodium/calcium exchanger membrane region domain-containing protein n=1 Tax=Asparagus officinalis TaxID=4686 RepID=A0A5P1FIV6_ASPOF|nr:uncharacterized protein A4U43_C02F13400 [Asparagus officinalis]